MTTFSPQLSITVPLIDFSGQSEAYKHALVWVQQRFVEPFDLFGPPVSLYISKS